MFSKAASLEPVKPTPESRREHERIEIAIPVTVRHEGRDLAGITRNLSVGGLFLEVPAKIPLGASVGLRFHLPNVGRPIVAMARVRWIAGPSGLAVQFDGLHAADVWALQQLITPAPAAH